MRKILAAAFAAAALLAGAAPAAAGPVGMHYHGHHTAPVAGAAMHFYG